LNFSGGIDILAAGSVDKRGIVMPNLAISVRLAMVMLPLAYVFAQTPDTLVLAGAVIVEPPTTGALGVELRIEGDTNRNASVRIPFRRTRTPHI
jgi:hypothetical protein